MGHNSVSPINIWQVSTKYCIKEQNTEHVPTCSVVSELSELCTRNYKLIYLLSLFTFMFKPTSDNYSKCLRCWAFCKYFGGWRLSLPYMAIGTALMVWPHNLWLSYVAGILLVLLAVLRLCLVFRFSSNSKDEGLLPQCDFEK